MKIFKDPWVLMFLACVILASSVIMWSATSSDPEPTSRCIDSKYRIFERGHSFSVVEDASCLNG